MITGEFHKGQKVRVSNGEPEPPKRFNRKHESWVCSNYTGYIYRDDGKEIGVSRTDPLVRTPGLVNVYQRNSSDVSVEAV